NSIESGTYPTISASDLHNLKTLVKKGMVSKVRVHYGPGYSAEPGQTVSNAQLKEDIYIISAESSL
ncbi:MAG: hypothetical protein ABIA66_00745, partial [Candidatus Omnitrophota bacterium]